MNSNNVTSNIVVKIHGGLGNQLFQYALGRSLALTYKQPVTYDISWYGQKTGEIQRPFDLKHFQVTLPEANPEEIRALLRFQRKAGPIGWLKSFLTADSSKYVFDESYSFNPKILSMKAPAYLHGFWQSPKYFAEISDVIRKEFTPIRPPNEVNQQMLTRIQSGPAISLHVRRGDYVSNKKTNSFHGTMTLDYYRSAIAKLQSHEPGATIYVFSDDPDWVKQNLTFDLPTVFVDCNGAATAYEDLRLMSSCDHHVIANSTFSWWGAWLNQRPHKLVVAPARWFAHPDMKTDDLLPAEWIKI
jgi:hypothetical protein